MSVIIPKINQLCGLISAFGTELKLNTEKLEIGQMFLLIQELQVAMAPLVKFQDNIKKEYASIADTLEIEDKTTVKKSIFGATCYYKIAYVKPSIDTDKVVKDYTDLLADYNLSFDFNKYSKEVKPRKTLIIE